MAQGFKTKSLPKDQISKKNTSTKSKVQPKNLKKGARDLPPKKAGLVSQANVLKRNTSSHASSLEKTIAAQALSHGKLTIMKKAAEERKEKAAEHTKERGEAKRF